MDVTALLQGSNKDLVKKKLQELAPELALNPGQGQPLSRQVVNPGAGLVNPQMPGAQEFDNDLVRVPGGISTLYSSGQPEPMQPSPAAVSQPVDPSNPFFGAVPSGAGNQPVAAQPQQVLVSPDQYTGAVNQIPVTNDPNDPISRRALLPIPGQTPIDKNDTQVAGLTQLTPEQQDVQDAMTAYRDAQKLDPKKLNKSKWKDILAYIVQGANAAFNPQPGQKIVGYGQVKKDNQIRAAEQKLNMVQGSVMKNAQINATIQKPLIDREKLRAQAAANQARIEGRLDAIRLSDDFKKGVFKLVPDAQGKMWKEFTNDPNGKREPVINPATGEQEFAPGEQMVDWIDPNTGNVIQVKAKQVLMPSATIALNNARSEQGVREKNAQWDLDAQKTNLSAMTSWYNANQSLALTIAKQQGETDQTVNDMTGAYNRLQEAQTRYQQLLEKANTDKYAVMQEDIDKAFKAVQDADKDYSTSIGKMKSAAAIQQALDQQKLVKPTLINPPKIEAVKVTGGIKQFTPEQRARRAELGKQLKAATDKNDTAEIQRLLKVIDEENLSSQ